MNRESIYQALFLKLDALRVDGTLVRASRRLKHIEDLQPSDFPAAFQVQDDELANARMNLPTVWTLNVQWWLNFYEADENAALTVKMNPVLDKITELLDPSDGVRFEGLGGLVFRASINGPIEVVEGVLGDRGLAIIPIKITKVEGS